MSIRKGALQCAVNPEAGREEMLSLRKAKTPKKVWVVGGGPAGMKSGGDCRQAGASRYPVEKKKELGGQFLFAAIPPCKQVLNDFSSYLIGETRKLPVRNPPGKNFSMKPI